MENDVNEIKNDVELRPYFFDFICRGFILGLSDKFQVPESERVRFQKNYYDSLLDLSTKIEKKFKSRDVLPIIHLVSTHYLKHIGRIGFEQYQPDIK